MNDKYTEQFFSSLQLLESDQIQGATDALLLFGETPGVFDRIFVSLDSYFRSGTTVDYENVKTYFYTSWRWYVLLGWRLLMQKDYDTFVFLYTHGLSTAYMLGIDVEAFFFEYLHVKSFSQSDLLTLDTTLVTHMKELSAPLHPVYEKSISYTEVLSFSPDRVDSVAAASFYASVQDSLFPQIDSTYGVEQEALDQLAASRGFYEFVSFVVNHKDIEASVNQYLGYLLADNFLDSVSLSSFISTPEEEKQAYLASLEGASTQEEVEPTPDTAQWSVETIRQTVLDRYGDEVSDTQILALLAELSETYGDEHIRYLYFYDEERGGFVWNDDLSHT